MPASTPPKDKKAFIDIIGIMATEIAEIDKLIKLIIADPCALSLTAPKAI